MTSDLSEEEMRRALFGDAEPASLVTPPPVPEATGELVFEKPKASLQKKKKKKKKKKVAKAFTPRLQVTLMVGNEYEGKMFELIHQADTLSKLLAEQEAVKAARKKFRYVEVVDVKSM
ncbi:hypothetical protein F0170_09510 [Pseudomonas sp. MAFF 730085]|uniref:Uncharacterized protein n=1 Tax=Pseudomonas kitaguniensis TaxID=2607908 RepID=A0A5N7JS81_9PSED|nr:hypothetical protein [Pseudomonas kitaguniensis]MPQ84201.1 hypothetical protein [Pseudomonas kitaguniensis]